jgi:hypothetical protein
MLHSINATPSSVERPESLVPARPAAEVPSDQLWRQAIQATRDAPEPRRSYARVMSSPRPGRPARRALNDCTGTAEPP